MTADYATVLVNGPVQRGRGPPRSYTRNKAPGIVKGSGSVLLSFQPVRPAQRSAARPGTACGYQGGVFPAGLPVGVAERVDPAGAASLVPWPRSAPRPPSAPST